jgi:hypothetical protein
MQMLPKAYTQNSLGCVLIISAFIVKIQVKGGVEGNNC